MDVSVAGLLLVITVTSAKHINSYAGPYTAYIIAFPPCDRGAVWDGTDNFKLRLLSAFNPSKPWEPQKFQANFSYGRVFADKSWVRVTVASRSNNQWKRNAFVFSFPMAGCSSFRANMPWLYEALMHRSARSTDPCVVAPGFYQSTRGAVFNASFPNVPVMPYGHWLFQACNGQPGSAVAEGCWQAEAKTIPKIAAPSG